MGSITALFFLFGFITCLNDILVPHLKELFALNYQQSILIQFCFFSAYFLFSFPSGIITKRFGYSQGIVGGLALAGLGALLFLPAAYVRSYPLFLSALFVLACGITLIQVAANPYVSELGPSHLAPSRLTMVQAFNSLGTTLAPFVGTFWILSSTSQTGSQTDIPYLAIGLLLLALATLTLLRPLPAIIRSNKTPNKDSLRNVHQFRLGVLGIFFYVGAEVGIGSFLVNHIVDSWKIDSSSAGGYVAFYWFLAMIGRFLSMLLLRHFRAWDCLFLAGICTTVLALLGVTSGPEISPWCFIACGLFNSLMFPVIFTLSIDGLGDQTERGSSYLCMAIVGGAILPLIQGGLADHFGLQASFVLPALAYMYVAYFALSKRSSHAIALSGV